ncbi:phospholipase D-like domain-containing protein [Halobacillus litoralis]|uniref:phospholipase D-like domain-containing protein n=1 Tax=Halobacillus litoralis TaxID=45668 RepID=UPI001CD30A0E|nr:phospholipase D-like domain-containing protein [Halobacillus litoralis]MCA0971059.1 phospholipase D-like domain-containing protein [Halobacillus litoralis]
MLTILIIAVIFLLLFLDFHFGRKAHHQNARKLSFKQTTADYKLYKNGSPMYEDLFNDIHQASVQVDIYFYLIDNDYISRNFLQVLMDKAKEGVPVRLLGDRLGCFKLDRRLRQELEEAGVIFRFAEVPGFPYFFYRLQRRNHRKIAIIDGEIGYVGGYNIGMNYIGESSKFRDWRDYHLRSTGQLVRQLHEVLLDDWYLATGEKREALVPEAEGSQEVRIVATDGVDLEDEMYAMIERAERELLIGTPYFIPTERLMAALHRALDRDVDMKIMIPMKADHPFVKEAAIPYLKRMRNDGAKVGFFDAGFYHAKVVIVDGVLADLGTANFDRRSLFLNKEVNTFIYERNFVQNLRNMYLEDFGDAIAFDDQWLNNRSIKTRINEKIAVLLRPFL